MIYHIITGQDLAGLEETGRYHPASLDDEGFIHCSGSVSDLLAVANRFFRGIGIFALEIDESSLGEMVRWEAPTHEGLAGLFPHLYCELEYRHCTGVRRFVRDRDGACTGIY